MNDMTREDVLALVANKAGWKRALEWFRKNGVS